jgi:D-alanyl-D-alanine carboxypeptidase
VIPASTTKVSTSAAALLRLSPHYRFRTAFLSASSVREGMLPGDLWPRGMTIQLVLEEA